MNDLTIIYLTANKLSDHFRKNMQVQLEIASGDSEIITVSKQPLEFPFNQPGSIIFNTPSTHINIYREALAGVKNAETKYIAIAEDDVLYSPEHFKYRPKNEGHFAYNISCWMIYTWVKPAIFSHRILGSRRNHGMLICERDLYIKAFEERFAKYSDDSKINNAIWAEPGKYEKNLGVTEYPTETFYTNPPNIMFSHDDGLSNNTLGHKKRLGELRALEIPYWGKAEEVLKLYE